MAINLLPKDISEKNKASNRGKAMDYLTYVLIVLAAVVMVGGALLVHDTRMNVDSLQKEQRELLTEVDEYKKQEQQLIFLKDRLGVVNNVLGSRSKEKFQDLHAVLFDSMPGGVRVLQQSISDSDNSFTIQAESAAVLRDYIRNIRTKPEFSKITLTQLNYSPLIGYQANLSIE